MIQYMGLIYFGGFFFFFYVALGDLKYTKVRCFLQNQVFFICENLNSSLVAFPAHHYHYQPPVYYILWEIWYTIDLFIVFYALAYVYWCTCVLCLHCLFKVQTNDFLAFIVNKFVCLFVIGFLLLHSWLNSHRLTLPPSRFSIFAQFKLSPLWLQILYIYKSVASTDELICWRDIKIVI